MRRMFTLIVLVTAMLIAGCSEGATETDATPSVDGATDTPSTDTTTEATTATTETPTVTATATATGSPTETSDPQRNSGIEIVNTTDADGDGRFESFDIHVRANTSIPETDGGGDDTEGEPYFAVRAGGQWRFDTAEVARTTDFETTIPMNESVLPGSANENLSVTVRLHDRDLLEHDQIVGWSVTVPYAPVTTPTPTVTAAPTATATATPTATPTATATPTTTTTSTPTPTTTTTPTPTATATPTTTQPPIATATPTPTPEPARGPDQGTEWTVTVVEVIDGDTVKVEFPSGDTENVRLLGVDSPETSSEVSPDEFEGIPNNAAGRQHLRDWAGRASNFASQQLSVGEQVRIEVDPQADRKGSFGRLLVYLYHDGGQLFNRELLDDGYARLYDSQFSKRGGFADVEAQAQANGVGLWNFDGPAISTPTPTPASQQDGGGGGLPTPSGGPSDPYDCGDLTYEQAQQVLQNTPGDPSDLDRDGDGEACQSKRD